MSSRSYRSFVLALTLWFGACGSLLLHGPALAQAPGKKVVRTQDDLPRFNYPIPGTATQLLQSDAATFNMFAAKVRTDVDSLLHDYDIQDRPTLRDLLGGRLRLQRLAGTQDQAALATSAHIRALEHKPDAN